MVKRFKPKRSKPTIKVRSLYVEMPPSCSTAEAAARVEAQIEASRWLPSYTMELAQSYIVDAAGQEAARGWMETQRHQNFVFSYRPFDRGCFWLVTQALQRAGVPILLSELLRWSREGTAEVARKVKGRWTAWKSDE